MVKLLGSMTTFIGWSVLLTSSNFPLAVPLYCTMTGRTVWAALSATSAPAASTAKARSLNCGKWWQFIGASQSLCLDVQSPGIDPGGCAWRVAEINLHVQIVRANTGQVVDAHALREQLPVGSGGAQGPSSREGRKG